MNRDGCCKDPRRSAGRPRCSTIGATLVVLTCSGMAASAADLHVSPAGNDRGPGTQEQPLATLTAARNRARAITGQPVTVHLSPGTYYLSDTLAFTSADSRRATAPMRIIADPPLTAVVSGGQRLTTRWQEDRQGVWRAAVPPGFHCDQLFINGMRQPMARWPNYDPQSQYFQGYSPDATAPERIARWADPTGGFVHAMHRSLWGDMHWRILGKQDDGSLRLEGGWQNNRQMGAHKKYRFVENIHEELDAPGEWFFDAADHQLYCIPPTGIDLNSALIETVRLKHLVEYRGSRLRPVRFISLEGIRFTHAARTFMDNKEPLVRSDWTTYRGGALLFEGTEDCSVSHCEIDQVGGNGVFVNKYNRRLQIAHCELAKCGASGISFVGDPASLRSPLFEYHQTQTLEQMDQVPGPRSPDYPADCGVEDCLIYLNGRVEKQTAGVNICMAESITIRHCSIYDCPRAGINIGDGAFGGHLIEYCDVFDTVKETGDHGSFNSWGRDRFWHPDRSLTAEWVKRFPEMPKWDCRRTNILRNSRWRCDHGWDIDLDDGSSNYAIYNNLCLAGGIKLREGYFRDVYNNVIIDNTFCPHVWYPACHTSFHHNIIGREKYAPARMKSTDQGDRIDFNLVHRADQSPVPAEQLALFGGDRHSLVADAIWLDPASGDYRVGERSPAIALGFKNFAMDRFGVVSPRLKQRARTPELPASTAVNPRTRLEHPATSRKPATWKWKGLQLEQLRPGEHLSALGLAKPVGVLITSVAPGSPGAEWGLLANDVIQQVNGSAIRNLADLRQAVERRAAGQMRRLTVWRNQDHVQLTIR